jgi:hypothetical protein
MTVVYLCYHHNSKFESFIISWNTFHATQIFNTFIITTTVCVSEFIDIFEDVKKDRILTVNILKAIVDMGIEKSKMTDLLVPINCHGDHYLKFETVDKCSLF